MGLLLDILRKNSYVKDFMLILTISIKKRKRKNIKKKLKHDGDRRNKRKYFLYEFDEIIPWKAKIKRS